MLITQIQQPMYIIIFPIIAYLIMIAFKQWTGLSKLLNSSSGEALEQETYWLTHAQKGDRLAFQKLLEQHYDSIYQVAYRFTGHSEDAEDITQEVCIGLARKIQDYRGEAKFKTWLYRIIINTCLDSYRKQNREQSQIDRYLEFEAHNRTVSDDRIQQVTWLYRELAKLKNPFKETAFLVLAEDLSHAEVGEVLGCPESTISWRMHEIRNQLKAVVENDHGA
ncbi:ECF RNA polymerase sigma factor SigW [uncultured bacterium]|nr:ECF RNA polymerase sigma factor SigW [uncultured bacterium]